MFLLLLLLPVFASQCKYTFTTARFCCLYLFRASVRCNMLSYSSFSFFRFVVSSLPRHNAGNINICSWSLRILSIILSAFFPLQCFVFSFYFIFFPCSFHSLCVDYWVRKIIYETRTDGFLLNSKRFIVSVAHIRIATNQSLVHERSTRLHTIYFFFRIYTREMLSRGFAAVWRRLLLDLCVDASIGRWWFVAINIIGHWCRVTCNS